MPGDENYNESDKIISHVAIKPPPFYRKSPLIWFKQMESQFALGNVTNKVTKFHHIMAHLPEDIVVNLAIDDLTEYDSLKKVVLESLQANKHELIDQALAAIDLGDKRPTQAVVEIKRKFNDVGIPPNDDLIKSRHLTALPVNIRSALVGHDSLSLEQYAKIADSMVAVVGSNPYNIAAVTSKPE